MNTRNIQWSDKALKSFRETVRYIINTFGKNAARKFDENIAQWEIIILQNPAIGSKEPLLKGERKEYRSIVVHKNNKLIYYVENDTLHVADLWDTRREPHIQADSTINNK